VRVVFLTHNYPRFPGDLAGAFLHPLALGLRRLGHEVRVVAPSEGGQGGEDAIEGVPVRRVRYASPDREQYAYSGTMQSAVRSPAGLLALARLIRNLRLAAREEAANRPDTVIHAHWWIPAGLAAPPERPLVLTVHGTDGALLRRSRVARYMAAPLFRRTRVITTVSSALARTVAEATGVGRGRCEVQPMPVDTHDWGWSTGGGGCLVVARLTRQKRVQLVLEALAVMQGEGRDLPCTIVGDGPERAELEALARGAGITHLVRFAGRLPFDRVKELLFRADLAVVPFEREGFGLAAAEALMAGVPVVACEDGGGLLDVVPSTGPGRVVAADPISLAGAMTQLLEDHSAREQARQAGATWRLHLTPDTVAARFAGWYAEAAGA
jgi:glycosyltransferase involved in cell wall biosynthesis